MQFRVLCLVLISETTVFLLLGFHFPKYQTNEHRWLCRSSNSPILLHLVTWPFLVTTTLPWFKSFYSGLSPVCMIFQSLIFKRCYWIFLFFCLYAVRLAKLHTDDVLTAPCPTTVLYPQSGGNLHSFTSVASCAVLDVLAPPYSENAGRICTYFHDYPFSSFCKWNICLPL